MEQTLTLVAFWAAGFVTGAASVIIWICLIHSKRNRNP